MALSALGLFSPFAAAAAASLRAISSAFAFSHGSIVLPRITAQEGGDGGRVLANLVLTFVFEAGEIVRVRADPVCETLMNECSNNTSIRLHTVVLSLFLE